ncbi:MAG: hypothetical protein PHX80_05520 [Candidatus Nanoarchaeia archaeon]|nr:hypothetical protein [Candidatus Nanoarchaeia archaeon]
MDGLFKILLACPVSNNKEYIFWDWLTYIKKLTYPVDLFFVDNSPNLKFVNKISDAGYNCAHLERTADDFSRRYSIAASMEFIRVAAESCNYDYLFSLECDVFPPLDIVERLLKLKNQVAGAIYFTNHGADSQLMITRIEHPMFGPETVTRILTTDESFLFCDGYVKQVFGCGLGCVLIHKDILKKIKFRVIDDQFTHHDVIFYNDLYNLKIPVYADTSIICKHFNSEWHKIFKYEKAIKS